MKIAVIGMGSIGKRHYHNLNALGYSEVRGWDTNPTKGDPIDWAWGPEVVLVCTPPADHVRTALKALSVGVAGLFVEKPLSNYWGLEEKDLLREAEAVEAVTMVGCNWRFQSGMDELLFRPGPLAIWATVPIPLKRRSTPMFDIGVHWLDLERWSGHTRSLLYYSYDEPYCVWIACGDALKQWTAVDDFGSMYVAEMEHFMHCVKRGEKTGNDLRQAADTLKLALAVRDGKS